MIDDSSDPGAWRREMQMRPDYKHWLEREHHRLMEENESMRRKLLEVVAYCSQGGADGEPYDTIYGLATGEKTFLIQRK